jgi:pimeloyl-ACP methyl ester carboxylesterase
MRLDISVHEGRPDRPAFVFVHGLGMSKHIWTAPPEARIMGGLFPLGVLLRDYGELRTLYHDLRDMGLTVLAWSQSRPVGPVGQAVKELMYVTGLAGEMNRAGLVFVCHSRGGLILRQALPGMENVKAVVTLSTPHLGTGMARWAAYLSPLASSLNQLLPDAEKGRVRTSLKRSLDFMESRAVKDLLPGSDFLLSLRGSPPEGCYCLSAGGTDPRMFKLGGSLQLPETLEKLIPGKMLPEEMQGGKGDGLVSARSARLPYADEHLEFHVNHPEMIVDPEVRRALLKRLRKRLDL